MSIHLGNLATASYLPYQQEDIFAEKELESILDCMIVRRRGMHVTKGLVKWKHQLLEDATWKYYYNLKKNSQPSILEIKDSFKGRAMLGYLYSN